jgi:osmotically-inducible protein OsmY
MKPLLSNKLIRDAVLEELESDPEVSAKHISVTVNNGAVTLGGHVVAIHQKHAAVRAAERVDAVRAVADDIEVREPSLHELPDDEIAEEIAGLRGWRTQIPDTVAAEVRGGRVILHGQVGSESERNAAESAVRRLTGARVVDTSSSSTRSRTDHARAAASVGGGFPSSIRRLPPFRGSAAQATLHAQGQNDEGEGCHWNSKRSRRASTSSPGAATN